MMRTAPSNPRADLTRVIGDARLLGGLFTLLGAAPGLLFLQSGQPINWMIQLFALSTVVTLVGPGVWYVIATFYIGRLETWAVRTSLRVAAVQASAVVALMTVPFLARSGFRTGIFVMPAFLALIFLPALIALCFQLRRASNLIRLIEPNGRAFEPVGITPVLDISTSQSDRGEVAGR